MKPLVYLSSPYSKGDQALNVKFQCDRWHEMFCDGMVTPITPLWTHFQHILHPMPWECWMEHDLELIARCDALIRLNAVYQHLNYEQIESRGADEEVEFARKQGIPTFFGIPQLYAWAKQWTPSRSSVQDQ